MNWFAMLGILVLVVALLSVFGFTPKGGKSVSRTRLMSMARVILILFGLILLYLAFKG